MTARRDLLTNWNRRQFLRAGGLTVATGALVAACGDSGSDRAIPRVGTVPSTTALPPGDVTDVVLLRTATSLEYTALYVYDAVASLGVLPRNAAAIADQLADDHRRHADLTADLTTEIGGEEFRCPNPRLQRVYIEPAMRLILGSAAAAEVLGLDEVEGDEIPASNDAVTDILVFAQALESLAAATYQSLVVALNDKALRPQAMTIGGEEAQHASLLGIVLNPEQLVNVDGLSVPEAASPPTTVASAVGLPTTVVTPDVTEAPATAGAIPVYAVPSTFGLLSPVQLQLGAPNESGIRTTLNLETPSLNSLAYEYLGACEE
jgi:rubrerythrin